MSKYIDALDELQNNISGEVYRSELIEILRYLDDHPELTGKIITESEYRHAMLAATDTEDFDAEELLRRLGLTVVPDPDPKPTNADKLAEILRSIHDQASPEYVAESLDELGVRAPDHD